MKFSPHGEFVYKEIIYRNWMWLADYLSSQTWAIMPRWYSALELLIYSKSDDKDMYFYDDVTYQKLECEVIWNLYENPELIPN